MNNRVVWIVIGGALGGLTGYLVADLILDKIYEDQLDADVRKVLDEHEERMNAKADEALELRMGPSTVEDVNPRVRQYNTISNQEEKQKLEDLVVTYGVSDLEPRVITEDMWHSAHPPVNKVEITFYTEDDVFCDAEGNQLGNVDAVLGDDIRELFEDDDVVYIRNDHENSDFEVQRIEGSYAVYVMGLSEEEANPQEKKEEKTPKKTTARGKRGKMQTRRTPPPEVDEEDVSVD